MLMFSKVSIKSFVYDLIDIFMFPNQETKEVYKKYQVEKCYVYHNLTDADSTSVFCCFYFWFTMFCEWKGRKKYNIWSNVKK